MEKVLQTSWLPPTFEPGLVSVVIPTFNRASLLVETVQTVFSQSLRPLELIVCDDGSTDDTLERLDELKAPADVTMRISPGTKQGACHARNRGAAISNGEFLMFLDSDDLLIATALELLRACARESKADVAWGRWRYVEVTRSQCTLSAAHTRNFSDDWLVDLLRNGWLATCSTLYRRSFLSHVGGWAEDAAYASDFYFNSQLALEKAKLAEVPQVTAYYRLGTSDQLSYSDFGKRVPHTQFVLKEIENALNERNAWTDPRQKALAWRYFYTARDAWRLAGDRTLFMCLMREAHRVDSTFKTPNRWYNYIAKVGGYQLAERLADVRRTLKEWCRRA